MTVEIKDLFANIIDLTLKGAGLNHSKEAVKLLMETMAIESDLGQHTIQIGGGPGVGVFQCEPDTLHDMKVNYMKYRYGLHKFMEGDLKDLNYSIIIARIHYMRVRAAIPTTRGGRSLYYKKYYNTYKGKSTVDKYMKKAQLYLGDE